MKNKHHWFIAHLNLNSYHKSQRKAQTLQASHHGKGRGPTSAYGLGCLQLDLDSNDCIMTVIFSTSNKSTGCLPLASIDGSTTFHCSGWMAPKGRPKIQKCSSFRNWKWRERLKIRQCLQNPKCNVINMFSMIQVHQPVDIIQERYLLFVDSLALKVTCYADACEDDQPGRIWERYLFLA